MRPRIPFVATAALTALGVVAVAVPLDTSTTGKCSTSATAMYVA